MINNLNVLITRPKPQGLQLQQALSNVGISACCQSLFEYQSNTSEIAIKRKLHNFPPDIVIFVSVAAVNFANQAFKLSHWLDKNKQIIAVGKATQQSLQNLDISCISSDLQNSEGLLSLAELSKSTLTPSSKILIVRGDGGREFLAEQLKARGAIVEYLESYQRGWLKFPMSIADNWQQKNINTLVITSNALLERIVDLINISDNYWQNTCLWLVASERIMQTANKLGLQNVINTNGANDEAIIETLLRMGPDHD